MLEKATPNCPNSSEPCIGTVTPSSPSEMRREALARMAMGRAMRFCTNQVMKIPMGRMASTIAMRRTRNNVICR